VELLEQASRFEASVNQLRQSGNFSEQTSLVSLDQQCAAPLGYVMICQGNVFRRTSRRTRGYPAKLPSERADFRRDSLPIGLHDCPFLP
jgi:hypothetical protein